MAGSPDDPVDAERWCSVPRNDVHNQVLQPKPRQVEWAADQAVMKALTFTREANWKNDGMSAYSPQSLFPPGDLAGGGHVPPQVLLGIATQESNLWQASNHALPGEMGNPLIGNFYGLRVYDSDTSNDWDIHWDLADCGYGVMQLTDGMRLAGHTRPGETPLPADTQRAVALDFTVNIAAGLQLLTSKWNQTRQAGLIVDNGDAASLESWFFAVWAYNSGFHANAGDGSPWGVGWANNPANPHFDPQRNPFLEYTYDDARTPQRWPYPEKVLGWAGHPINSVESPGVMVAGYRAAWWNTVDDRKSVKPPPNTFCDSSDDCRPGQLFTPDQPGDGGTIGEPAGPCAHQDSHGFYDLRCWYHGPVSWKVCPLRCGKEVLRFDPGYAYQSDGTSHLPACDLTGLPAGSLVIDDLPDSVPSMRDANVGVPCTRKYTGAGSFALSFAGDNAGNLTSKIDTHQLGTGFNGHVWFAHTRRSGAGLDRFRVTGTWTLGRNLTGLGIVRVHLPASGAQTTSATYQVDTGKGIRSRTISQAGSGNRWVSLGAFAFDGVPKVQLSTLTADGDGTSDVAWDAVAVQPVTGRQVQHTVQAVALFDENQDLDTGCPACWLPTPFQSRASMYQWATALSEDITRLPACTGTLTSGCAGTATKAAMQRWHDQIVAAGTDPVQHPDGVSMADWLGLANPYTYRPTGPAKPANFDTDDSSYKIRSKATVSFVADPDGKVVDGSQTVSYDDRTGDSHIPEFVRDLFAGIQADYGIGLPNLQYTTINLNVHDGQSRTVTPQTDGVLPGRAYPYAGKAPVVTDADGVPTATGSCVAVLHVSGGLIGWRPALGVASFNDGYENWMHEVENRSDVPADLITVVNEINNAFFKDGLTGSIFGQAPPIWQELNFRLCSDGSLKQNSGRPILRSSHMPNQYLYDNDVAIDQLGQPTGTATPLILGDFVNFSHLPDPSQLIDPGHTAPLIESPYGECNFDTGRSGNPWNVTPLPSMSGGVMQPPGYEPPSAHFCVDMTVPTDPDYSG